MESGSWHVVLLPACLIFYHAPLWTIPHAIVGFLKVGCVRPAFYIPGAHWTVPHSGLLPWPEQWKCDPGSLRPRQVRPGNAGPSEMGSSICWQPDLQLQTQHAQPEYSLNPCDSVHSPVKGTLLLPRALARIKWSIWDPEAHKHAGQAMPKAFISKPSFHALWQWFLISDAHSSLLGIFQNCWCSHLQTFRFGVQSEIGQSSQVVLMYSKIWKPLLWVSVHPPHAPQIVHSRQHSLMPEILKQVLLVLSLSLVKCQYPWAIVRLKPL